VIEQPSTRDPPTVVTVGGFRLYITASFHESSCLSVASQSFPRRWWLFAFLWWTLNGVASASQYVQMAGPAGERVTWRHALVTSLASAYLWVPLTMLALWLAHQYPLGRGRLLPRLGLHLLLGMAVVIFFRAGAVLVLNPWVGWYATVPPLPELLLTSAQNNAFLYSLLVGVAHAAYYARESRRRDEQLAEARLLTLKAQIQPHFLFNTLNTIALMVRESPTDAERLITRLSELFRHALEGATIHEVPLADELRFAAAYLEIEAARFEERLRVEWQIDPAALKARVPHLILQPLVENAIRHGIAPRSAAGRLRVAARREDGRVRLEVEDDGVGLAVASQPGAAGVGLANVRARLAALYGPAGELALGPTPGGGVTATLVMPYRAWAP
jgi:two-component system, LytTR family, sensor kinase